LQRNLTHKAMRRLFQVVGHLHGQTASWGEFVHKGRQNFLMIWHPLKRGVRENQIEGSGIAPSRMSATSKSMFGRRLRAASIISGELSMPRTLA
jgi:hypothetical protein